jgi:DNA-binding MarR family transcriptional regulator
MGRNRKLAYDFAWNKPQTQSAPEAAAVSARTLLIVSSRESSGDRASTMHAILFSLKRSHQRFLLLSRDRIAAFGITPARFDMLYAIEQNSEWGLRQADLRTLLGVTGATISRMAASLEKLGLILRERNKRDRRHLDVALTARGAWLFDRAYDHAISSQVTEMAVERMFAVRWGSETAFQDLLIFEETLFRARKRLGDIALLHYPWHPDD